MLIQRFIATALLLPLKPQLYSLFTREALSSTLNDVQTNAFQLDSPAINHTPLFIGYGL